MLWSCYFMQRKNSSLRSCFSLAFSNTFLFSVPSWNHHNNKTLLDTFFSWWTQFIFRIFAIFYCLCIFGFLKIRLQRKDTRKEVRTFELEKMIVWLLWNFCPLCISTFLSNFGSKALIKGRQMQVLHCSERLHKIREKQILLLQFGSILLRVITLNFCAKNIFEVRIFIFSIACSRNNWTR